MRVVILLFSARLKLNATRRFFLIADYLILYDYYLNQRRGGLMVSTLDSGSSGPSSGYINGYWRNAGGNPAMD